MGDVVQFPVDPAIAARAILAWLESPTFPQEPPPSITTIQSRLRGVPQELPANVIRFAPRAMSAS